MEREIFFNRILRIPVKCKEKIKNLSSSDYFILVFSCAIFLFVYWNDISRPGVLSPLGYYGNWWDQIQYYKISEGISKGTLGPFTFPFGYPLFGFLGSFLNPGDPFLAVDFAGFVLFTWLSYRIFKKFFSRSLSIISGILLAMVTVQSFVTPVATTISALCLIYIVYITIYERYGYLESILAGLCIGLAFAARIGDVIPVLFAYGFYIGYPILKNKKYTLSNFIGIPIALAILGLTVFINLTFSGNLLGNYGVVNTNQKFFNIISMPYNIFGFFINPFPFSGETYSASIPLLRFFFFFILAPLGLYLLVRNAKTKKEALFFIIILTGWSLLYLAHVGISAVSLKYMVGYHYLKMIFPILMILSIRVVDELSRIENPKNNDREFLRIIIGYFFILAAIIYFFITFFNFSLIPLNQNSISVIPSENPSLSKYMTDNNLDTRWDSGSPQKKGMNITIRLDKVYLINRIIMDSTLSPGGIPQNVDIYYSINNLQWEHQNYPTYTGFNSPSTIADIYFPPMSAKYVKIELSQDNPNWWGIHELKIYGR
jgi:hypothetical protein